MKIHLTFHVSLLQPLKYDLIGQQVPEPSPMYVENDQGPYFIDSIDNMRWNEIQKQFELLIKWEDYEKQTWESYDMIKTNTPKSVKEFHKDHLARPAPARWTQDGNKRSSSNTWITNSITQTLQTQRTWWQEKAWQRLSQISSWHIQFDMQKMRKFSWDL